MKTIFEKTPPEDGRIYCKICGEYLCDEDSSLFDGFDDNNNVIQGMEIITNEDNNKIEISEILTKKESTVQYIKLIADTIGIHFEDIDIYELLLLYDNMNQDELAELRYGMKGISDSDKHPKIQTQLKKIDKKDKSNYKKKKNTNY